MDSGANLQDAKTLMAAKAMLTKAGQGFATAIEEAQSDAERFGMWLNSEGPAHWERQRRLRTEKLNMDRSALVRKEMQMTADGRPPSTVDERKTVQRSEESVRRAEHCLQQLRKWAIEYQRVLAQFRAGFSPLSTYVDQTVPAAVASLNRMAQAIDAYLSTAPMKVDSTLSISDDVSQKGTSATNSNTPMRRSGSDSGSEASTNE
ncbi:hypothetical protein LBMAG51_06850 [Phycisphaerae bacterium]|nr:hypothetical protein LBMAG51_06850 [Phycisphaerae bacterium]